MELLRPITLGPVTVRNRLMFGPHETNLGRGRAISRRHVAYYRRRAAGGTGLVVTEEASVHPSDWPYERAPLAERCGPGWAAVADACRAEGAVAVAAIGHAGGQGSSAYSQGPLWAPSRVPEVATREVPKWMEHGDVDALIAGFERATRLAIAAGMGGVECNAGQHSLLRQFLSGLTNHRDDRWGTDRSALVRQVLTAVRSAAGGGVVGLRLCCDELAPWAGITPEEAVPLAAALAAEVDYLVVVRGSIYTVGATRPDGHTPPGFNRALTASVRAGLAGSTAVYWQGSVVDPELAEAGLLDGVCDGVEMTRAQIADPDLARKLSAGTPERVRPCILCNQACMVRDVRNPIVSCVVEPSAGHETEDPPLPGEPPPPARVRERHPPLLVVGAGPAGLECGRVAALGGRRVQVVERREVAGGLLAVAAVASGRTSLAGVLDWLVRECRRLGVSLELGRAVGVEEVVAHPGDVVLATGSRRGIPGYAVDPAAVLLDAAELLDVTAAVGVDGRAIYDDRDLPAGRVLVWDPIGGPIGVSVAETLAEVGRPVTLATPDVVVGSLLARSGDLAPANVRLQQAGVALLRRVELVEVRPGAARLVDRFSAEAVTVDAAAVVDAGPALPGDRLWRASGACLPRIGDAVAPRSLYEAILEGRRAALAVLAANRPTTPPAPSVGAATRPGPIAGPAIPPAPGAGRAGGAGGITAATRAGAAEGEGT